eukprot:m.76310 g.76310  ORF g.76310 m.76310 type:complete len:94 (+) comp14021_c0_seq1:3616-3897(+)
MIVVHLKCGYCCGCHLITLSQAFLSDIFYTYWASRHLMCCLLRSVGLLPVVSVFLFLLLVFSFLLSESLRLGARVPVRLSFFLPFFFFLMCRY